MIAPLFGSITRPLLSPLVSGLRDELFGAFTPRSLFNDGSIGVLYDNNDLTSFYLDAAGTTAATVNGLVGLQLDKSHGLVLGAERVNSPYSGTSSGAWVIGSSSITRNGESTLGCVLTSITTVSGWVRVSFDVASLSGDTFTVSLNGSSNVGNINSNGSKSYLINAPSGSALTIIPWGGSAGQVTITNISIKQLPGNHRYQSTTGSKPILRGTPTGAELFTAYGTPGAGWSVAGATGTATTASSALPTTTAATVGKHYRVTYTVTRSAGSVQMSFGGRTGVSRSAAGQYVEYFDNALNTNALTATGTGFTGTVRIDEVKDVSAGSVTAPYGLQYDGVDDFLQTASVNFTATDKMFVCAGVRKLSDAARGIVVELGTDPTVQNGVFWIDAPLDATNRFRFGNKGSLGPFSSVNQSAIYNAPVSAVVVGIGTISGDSALLRLNGVDQTAATNDQGTGNYNNLALYFGRRAGTSLPFNGLDFGFVIKGGTTTAAQISSTERWMAQRTGVSI